MKPVMLRAAPKGADYEGHVPSKRTKTIVERLSALGVPPIQIAARIGCTLAQLREGYTHELLIGASHTSEIAGKKLLEAIEDGNVQAAVWWSKARMGWSESVTLEGGDKPVVTEIVRRIVDPKQE